MSKVADIAIGIALISLVLGIFSRVTMQPLAVAPGGIEASVLLQFTNTCLLLAIALLIAQLVKKK